MNKLSKYIDHTLLKAEATPAQIEKLCKEAIEYDFASVCVNSCYVPQCVELLKNTDVKVCCVVGFPLGAMSSDSKAAEALNATLAGADEVDMVINVGMAKAGDWEYVKNDIVNVVRCAQTGYKTCITRKERIVGKCMVKVIIETCLLTDDEKVRACLAAKEAGADFVKTSTGFSKAGATVEDIKLMRKTVGPDMGVKAAGGIHTYDEAMAMIDAGATRIGASAGIDIVMRKMRIEIKN